MSRSRAVVITALSLEFEAMRAHLTDIREEKHPQGDIYDIGQFEQNWEVALAEIGMGNPGSAMRTERAIAYFKPDVVLFVGIAGGLKDVQLGDVIAVNKVYNYESGKAEAEFLSRPEVWRSTDPMEQRARAVVRRGDWRRRISGDGDILPDGRQKDQLQARVGAIAAGEKVLSSLSAPTMQLIKKVYGDSLATEMEGAGFLQAMHANPGVDALVIRGVSDLIKNKSRTDKQNWQEVAARHASAFAFEVLAKWAGNNDVQSEPQKPAQKPEEKQHQGGTGMQDVDWPIPEGVTTVPIKIYYSYVDSDETLWKQLKTHLSTYRRRRKMVEWEKGQIVTGSGELKQRLDHLDSADLVFVIVSPEYLDACDIDEYDQKEYQHIMQRRKNGGSDVIPIIMRPVADWRKEELGGVQALPRKEKKAVSDYSKNERDRVLMEVAQDLGSIIEGMWSKRNGP